MEIIKGKIYKAKKIIVYGPEGIGKSTFASKFQDPIFIDIEGSTGELDVARLPKPSSWTMLLNQIREIIANPDVCKTLVIDTVDWAERLCVEHICAAHNKRGIEEFGYGNGYVYCYEEIGRFLNLLQDVVDKASINVVLTAHAQIKKFEQPEEMGAYDRYEMKLGKKTSSLTSPLVREWADMVLFANYEIHSIAVDDKGKKHKAQGGRRVMFTTHHPCWDAKNRFGLPDKLPFDFEEIAHIFIETLKTPAEPKKEKQEPKQVPADKTKEPEPTPQEPEQQTLPLDQIEPKQEQTLPVNPKIPKALTDLMQKHAVDEWTIQTVVAKRGYYPVDTPIEKYDPDFINGVLVAAWDQVYKMIQDLNEEIPFN